MSFFNGLRPTAGILIATAIVLSIAMGLRQSLGLFMQPAVQELAITVADFTLAIAVQNLVWGFLQPIAGAWATRVGFRSVLVTGAVLYTLGLVFVATATGTFGIMLGAGVLIGAAMACSASAIAMAVTARSVPASIRSTALGMVSAFGSLGTVITAPIGQALVSEWGWRVGVAGFAVMALIVIPAAWIAGRVDRLPEPPRRVLAEDATARDALRMAMGHWPFVVMGSAWFICGLQLIFLTTHLPSYLEICGQDPMLGAQALAVIGAFNVIGSLFFGWAGGRWSKPALLGGIYVARSVVLAWYFATPPTPESTLLFAAVMGLLWLGVGPLVAGMIVDMFGMRWQAMIQGLAFTSHQLGSFVGAFGGGLIYDMLGSYDLAWKLGVGMGLIAGTIQLLAALPHWPGARPLNASG